MMGKAIAALDVGTTTIRCSIYNEEADLIGSARDQVQQLQPQFQLFEIDPEILWQQVLTVVAAAIKDAGLRPDQITCLGLSSFRGSSLTWRKSTGKPFHNIISWQDKRCLDVIRQLNQSYILKPSSNLAWIIKNVDDIQKAILDRDVAFGTLPTWLLYKMSAGREHIADISHLSVSGLWDPFTMAYSPFILKSLGIPDHILPTVVDTVGHLFITKEFGPPIPVTASISDVGASLFGQECFTKGDINLVLGTGTFVSVNTSDEIYISKTGSFPTVAWKYGEKLIYTLEGMCNSTGAVMKSALNTGLIEDPAESSNIAFSVPDTDGVSYIPAFYGIQMPINDHKAETGLVGVRTTTNGRHILRAMMEAIAFRAVQIIQTLQKETSTSASKIKLNGGISNSDFIAKAIASLTGTEVQRPDNVDMSALGAAYLAGLGAGIWPNWKSLPKPQAASCIFSPTEFDGNLTSRYRIWLATQQKFKGWHA